MKTMIKNAQVVSSMGVQFKNVYVDGEKFCAPFDDPDKVIDAEGRYLLPGVIDAHTHIEEFINGAMTADDFRSASISAAKGGTTTYIDFVVQRKGDMPVDCIKKQLASADATSCVDFAFHIQMCDVNDKSIAQLEEVIEKCGVTSVKVFMAFSKSGFRVSEPRLLQLLQLSEQLGFVLSVHAENEELMTYYEEQLLSQGKGGAEFYTQSRPVFTEVESVAKAITYAKEAGAVVYIVHLSSDEGLDKVKAADGSAIAETCIQYLVLDESKFNEPDAFKFLMAPPLRTRENIEKMWKGIADGHVKVLATDHSAFMPEDKLKATNFTEVPLGVSGIEHLLTLAYSEGVNKGRIPITKMVEVLSENPAKIFGLENKGFIIEGYDADFVLFDPNISYTIAPENIQSNCGYSLYEGIKVTGKPVMTAVRGTVVWENDRLTAEPGYGKYIARKPKSNWGVV